MGQRSAPPLRSTQHPPRDPRWPQASSPALGSRSPPAPQARPEACGAAPPAGRACRPQSCANDPRPPSAVLRPAAPLTWLRGLRGSATAVLGPSGKATAARTPSPAELRGPTGGEPAPRARPRVRRRATEGASDCRLRGSACPARALDTLSSGRLRPLGPRSGRQPHTTFPPIGPPRPAAVHVMASEGNTPMG